jgi:hypothetical protein
MGRLRFNDVSSIGSTNPITLALNGTTAAWASAPRFPTITAPDYAIVVVEPDTAQEEIVQLTAYVLGATSGTVVRNFEPTQGGANAAPAHTATFWCHGPTAADFAELLVTPLKTATYTIEAWDYVPTDISGGSIGHPLPTAPPDGTMVGAKVIAIAGSNTLTLTCGGSDVINKAGGSTTFVMSLLDQGVVLQYKHAAGVWYVLADDLPLDQLDLRYQPIGTSVLTTKGDVAGFSTVPTRIPVGADGTILMANSTQANGVDWGNAAALGNTTPNPLGVAAPGSAITAMRSDAVIPVAPIANQILLGPSGYYTWPLGEGGNFGDNTQGRMVLIPVTFDVVARSIGLGVNIDAAGSAGAVIRFGIYGDTNGLPGSVLADFGTTPATATGIVTKGAYTINPGIRYWVGYVCQGTPSTSPSLIQQEAGRGLPVPVPSFANPSDAVSVVDNGITGALPSTFTLENTGLQVASIIIVAN